MRIGIDVRYLSHGIVGGVRNYIATLVTALVQTGTEHQFFLYADTKRSFELTDLPSNVELRLLPYENQLSTMYHDFFMKREMEKDQLDIAHFPANYGFGPANARTVITLHDQINLMPLPELIRGNPKRLGTMAMMGYLHFCSTMAMRHVDLVITISEYSKARILEHANLGEQKITALLYPPSPHFHRIDDPEVLADVQRRYGLRKPFILADGIKNPAALVQAWKLLPADLRDQYEIVFFSRIPNPPAVVFEIVSAGYGHLLVRPSNEDLMALYTLADVFAFPSWIEGLGLPPLEAMTCGTPVVASNRGSIPEVIGNAGLMTDVDDIEGFSNNLERVLSDPAEADRLRTLGYARAAEFSWERTAQCYLEIYANLMALNSA